ncbi:MAG: roadblock/LC7 domain-containing protein [Candidatus Hermodarchaeota archaeon]
MLFNDNIAIESIDKELERLEHLGEILGTAVVKRNGLLISSRLPRDIDDRKLSALAATMFEAIETATSNFENDQIKNVTVEYLDYQLIIVGINEKIILVSLSDINANIGLIFIEIEESIKNLKQIIEK